MKTHALVLCILAIVALSACSQFLQLRDPTLDDDSGMDGGPTDAGTTGDGTPAADAPGDAGPPACVAENCPFGCDPDSPTNACRPAKLWVYATTGLFLGGGFGGQDNT